MTAFETSIGYSFKDKELLSRALTHSSYANERHSESNERLEFLGDSILGFLTARFLYERFPKLSEGELTRRRALLVCEGSLAKLARELDVGKHLRLGYGERASLGNLRSSILSDAFEAVLAAMYLDGGIDAAHTLLRRILLTDSLDFPAIDDPKTALQERVQREAGHVLVYKLVGETGPDHAKMFTVEAVLDGKTIGHGTDVSKKRAEQNAAREALNAIGN